MDNYTISGTNIMKTTSQVNETTLTLPYNARQSIEVAATNCIGTSGPATFTYFEGEVNHMLCIVHHIHMHTYVYTVCERDGLVESKLKLVLITI